MLIVCPNHHAMLDFAVLPINEATLALRQHNLSAQHASSHDQLCRERSAVQLALHLTRALWLARGSAALSDPPVQVHLSVMRL